MRNRILGVLLAFAVGCSRADPVTPSAPSAPPAGNSPAPQTANLPAVMTSGVEYVSFDGREGWTFAARGQNAGGGCAARVTGSARFMDAGLAPLQTVAFSLDASKRVQPAETFRFQACCLAEANRNPTATVFVSFSWDNVSCP